MATKHNTNFNNLQNEIESLNKKKVDWTESLEKQDEMIVKYETLSEKLEESEMIIKQKNKEVENKEVLSKNKTNGDFKWIYWKSETQIWKFPIGRKI